LRLTYNPMNSQGPERQKFFIMRVPSRVKGFGWTFSIAIHMAALFGLLGSKDDAKAATHHSVVSFSIAEPPTVEKQSPPAQTPQKVFSTVPRTVPHAPKTVAVPLEPPSPPSAPPPPTATELAGVTLTSQDGSGSSVVTGNGLAIESPILPTVIASTPTPISEDRARPVAVAISRRSDDLVPLRDLTDKPQPPALGAKLLEHYPPNAKRQGLAGKAKVRARIEADGTVRQATIIIESSTGFGAACQQTLLGSKWTPPRDKTGRPVPTQVHYTCNFRVND